MKFILIIIYVLFVNFIQGYAGDSLKNKDNEVVGLITDSWNCTNQSIRVLNILPYKSWINDIINTGYSSQTKLVRRMYTTFVD